MPTTSWWRHPAARWIRCLGLLTCALGCTEDAGRVTVRVDWDPAPPMSRDGLFVLTQVESAGAVVTETSPQPLLPELSIPLPAVPNGEALIVVAEVRRAPYRNAALAYRGQSMPFAMQAGARADVAVTLRPTTDDPRTFEGLPPRPNGAAAVYQRAPWGTAADPDPFARVVGAAGSVPSRADVLAFDGPDIAAAQRVGQATADEQGAFVINVTGTALGPPPQVYLAGGTRDGLLSDSSTRAGLQAELVRTVQWTATLRGKVPDSDFPNPHELRLVRRATAARTTGLETSASAAGLADVAGVDGRTVQVTAARRWLPGPTGLHPPPSVLGATTFDPVRGRVVHVPDVTTAGATGFSDLEGIEQRSAVWEWDGFGWEEIRVPGGGPTTRALPCIAFDGVRGEVMLYGGQLFSRTGDEVSSEMWHYNGARWTLTAAEGTGPGPRASCAMTFDEARGRVVLFGGITDADGFTSADTWEWDGRRWYGPFSQPDGPNGLTTPSLTYDPVGQRVVMFGNITGLGALTSDLWSWDGTRWSRIPVPADALKPQPRQSTGFAADNEGRLLLYGGVDIRNGGTTVVADGSLWAFENGAWRELDTSSAPGGFRLGHSVAFDRHRNELLVTGGIRTQPIRDTWVWDGTAWRDRSLRLPQPEPRVGARLAFDSTSGRVVMAGGTVEVAGGPLVSIPPQTWLWSGSAWLQARTDPDFRGYQDMIMVPHPDGGLLAYGGVAVGVGLSERTLFWRDGEWTPGPDGPPGRIAAAAYLDSRRGRVIMHGGATAQLVLPIQFFPLADAWRFDEGQWRPLADPGGPGARFYHAMDYLPAIDRGVLFGGIGPSGLAPGTWLYAAETDTWTRFEPPPGTGEPPLRHRHSLTYDPRRGVLVLFGGCQDLGVSTCPPRRRFNDVWEFDGTAWTPRVLPTPLPQPRFAHSATFDPARGTLLVFGGSTPAPNNELWAYDGARWSRIAPAAAPQGRLLHGMAWDDEEAGIVLFGGCLDPFCENALGDTWVWRGAGWAPLPTENDPVAVGAHMMAPAPQGGVMTWGGLRNESATALRQRLAGRRWRRAEPNDERVSYVSGVYVPALDSVLSFGGNNQEGDNPTAFVLGSLVQLRAWDAPFRVIDRDSSMAPPVLASVALAHDEGRGEVVLFGGEGVSDNQDETWVWSLADQQWRRIEGLTEHPSARREASFAYDDARGESLLFGGFGEFFGADLWSWDGQRWTRVSTVGPSPAARAGARLVYDPLRQTLVLFGGYLAAQGVSIDGSDPEALLFGDTWLLSSTQGQGPGAMVTIDVSAAGLPGSAVQSIAASAWAGGRAGLMDGAVLEVWDHFLGRWLAVADHAAPTAAPAPLVVTTEGPAAALRWAPSGELWLRIRARGESTAAAASLDGVEVTVRYGL